MRLNSIGSVNTISALLICTVPYLPRRQTTRLFQDILREGQRDRRPGDDWEPSVFLRMEEI
jgi:hypothetical protein